MQPKPWYTPFVIMLIIFILLVLFDVIFMNTYIKLAIPVSALVWFYLILWPVVVLAEAILYWVLRKKIRERKLVWVHLIFSLMSFTGLRLFMVLLSFISDILSGMKWPRDFIYYVNLIGFWGSLLLGHTALILALVRTFSAKEPQQPNDDNDFLSEITV